MKNNNIKLFSLILMVVLLAGVAHLMTGCQPSSGDYGVFDLRSDKPDAPVITAVLAGGVVDSATKTGLAGVAVKMFAVDKTLLREMNSVTDGSFLFNNVSPGTYLLETAVGSTQFDTATYTVLVNPDGTILPPNISLVVYPKGFTAETLVDIHGTVTASTTASLIASATLIPEKDVEVELFKAASNAPVGAAIATAKTQAMGKFLFPQQKPGIYIIKLTKPDLPKPDREDSYDLIVKNDGTAIPEIPLELILGN